MARSTINATLEKICTYSLSECLANSFEHRVHRIQEICAVESKPSNVLVLGRIYLVINLELNICDHPPRNQCKVTGSFSVYVISSFKMRLS